MIACDKKVVGNNKNDVFLPIEIHVSTEMFTLKRAEPNLLATLVMKLIPFILTWDSSFGAQYWDMQGCPSCPVLCDAFQNVHPEDVDRTLGRVKPTSCLLDSCSSCLIKEAQGSLLDWLSSVVNASLIEGRTPKILKEAVALPPSPHPARVHRDASKTLPPKSNLGHRGAMQLQVCIEHLIFEHGSQMHGIQTTPGSSGKN